MSDFPLNVKVSRAACRFEETNNQGRPTKLLLGRQEMNELEEIIRSNVTYARSGPPRKRLEFMGMDVYTMDDDEFLGVA